jgi:hypothetical protein
MLKRQAHRLTGTMQRYIMVEKDAPLRVHIWLAWKDNEMPDGEAWQRELAEFKAEFADVLDWGTERSSELLGLLYT